MLLGSRSANSAASKSSAPKRWGALDWAAPARQAPLQWFFRTPLTYVHKTNKMLILWGCDVRGFRNMWMWYCASTLLSRYRVPEARKSVYWYICRLYTPWEIHWKTNYEKINSLLKACLGSLWFQELQQFSTSSNWFSQTIVASVIYRNLSSITMILFSIHFISSMSHRDPLTEAAWDGGAVGGAVGGALAASTEAWSEFLVDSSRENKSIKNL